MSVSFRDSCFLAARSRNTHKHTALQPPLQHPWTSAVSSDTVLITLDFVFPPHLDWQNGSYTAKSLISFKLLSLAVITGNQQRIAVTHLDALLMRTGV